MKFEVFRDEILREVRFSGSVSYADLARLRLDRFERAQLNSEASTAADMLLDLELIFRRGDQQEGAG